MLFLNSNRKRASYTPMITGCLYFFFHRPGALIRNCAPFLRAKSTDRKIIVSSLPIARIALFCVLDAATVRQKLQRKRVRGRALENAGGGAVAMVRGSGSRGKERGRKSWLFRGLKLICMESTAKRLSCRLDFVLIRRQIARVRSSVYSV